MVSSDPDAVPANPTLFTASVTSSNITVIRVDIYDFALIPPLIGSVKPKSGTVTADFATGQRRTLSATFDPSVGPLLYTGVELWPFSGYNYGYGPADMLPLGQFPLFATDMSITPGGDNVVSPGDKWRWIQDSTFLTPWTSTAGVLISSLITSLVSDTGMWKTGTIVNTAGSGLKVSQVTSSVTSTALALSQVWDSDRQQAISDLCKAIGAEAFISRTGKFIIRDRQAVAAPLVTMTTGDGGRLIDCVVSTSTIDMYNVVTIIPTNTDPAFTVPQVTVRITDPNHPAYPRPGKIVVRPFRLNSAQFTSAAQALAAAQKILTKISGKALQCKLTVHPDASLSESDTIQINTPDGMVRTGQIQQITYPLSVADDQSITTVSTRSDEDFSP